MPSKTFGVEMIYLMSAFNFMLFRRRRHYALWIEKACVCVVCVFSLYTIGTVTVDTRIGYINDKKKDDTMNTG